MDLIEVLPAAVYVCDADGVVVSYNRRAAQLWGREPDIGDTDERYCGAFRLHRPDGSFLPHRETPMEAVLRTGEPASDLEVTIERPDGTRVTVLVNVAPLFDVSGKLVGAVNCFQDLTAQKAAEQERARLADELHQARKLEALGHLTAGVAHDFNNLLTPVLGSLDLMRDRIADPEMLGLLDSAMHAGLRGAQLSDRLLTFARRESLMPQAVDLGTLLIRMGNLLHLALGDAIRVETSVSSAWPALVDSSQIELVILNLAINARDAMPRGGTLTIAARNATIAADDRRDGLAPGDYVVLSIDDTGVGMSEDVRAKALEPFFTTKGPGEGTGLGLSMALGVARQSGGTLRLDSCPDQGTTIEIYLPRAGGPAAPAVAEDRLSVDPASVRGTVVLVVDDDPDVRAVTVAMLEQCGYGALEAASGRAALELLAETARIDLMLINLTMPSLDGAETARLARERRPDLRVLFSSGYADAAQRDGGSIDHEPMIAKPYVRDELARQVHACLVTPCS